MIKKLFSKKADSNLAKKSNNLPPESLTPNLFQTAMQHQQKGEFAEAETLYRQILQHEPNNSEALHALGTLFSQAKKYDLAIDLISKAINISPSSTMYGNLANIFRALNQTDTAIACYQQALLLKSDDAETYYKIGNLFLAHEKLELAIENYRQAVLIKPDFADAYCNLGVALKEQGKLDEAVENYRHALAITPDDAEVYSNLGEVLWRQGKLDAAIETYQQALAVNPNAVEVYGNLGMAFKEQNNLDKAVTSYQQVIVLRPNDTEAYFILGNIFQAQGRLDSAIENYQKAILLNPKFAAAHNNLGNTFRQQNNLDAAIASYHAAIAVKSDFVEAYNNLGIALQTQGNLSAALESYQHALLINPDYIDTHNNLGLVFHAQGKLAEAVGAFRYVLSIKPDHAAAHYNLGNMLYLQRKLDIAIESYQKSLSIHPDRVETLDMLFYTQLHCCDWSAYNSNSEKIAKRIESGEYGYNPFNFLATFSSAIEQMQCAKGFAKKYLLAETPVWTGQRYQHNKIRVAYLSADFHDHATTYLMAELIERHDKTRFEITAISFGPRSESEMRGRLLGSFDRFIDVQNMANREVAMLLQELEIDIAIDLKGYTEKSRPEILAHRAAPIQVNYLGYPGTMGAEYIDYILADQYVIPPDHQPYYTEKVVYLPDTYQVNDSKRPIAEYTPTRAEVDLPETGFVFCCFNDNYKITSDIFDIWMRLLSKTEDSVLWLFEGNPFASLNLKKEAVRRGIAIERLIFAPRMKLDKHLARHKLADMFLDTLPINAHTTASDALWAGLPVLTCMGSAFAGRVAGSLLHAVGLPELITTNLEEYEALAFKLATTPALLAEIRTKLAQNRSTYPLFNTDRFRQHIEAAYITMWERYQRGELPVSFAVQPIEKKDV